ncbi:hypothetical protein [Bacillus paranthracis]|uniref:hypothetical protein n=1 Tax=Bacillus paranthracis TaxID=2026186 RepID=UPI0021CFB955|nr:hypothetical protein [Bacillus paranthracis]MCU5209289.1 hypothetical protein [Bacillus paranthracis]
MSYKAKNGLIMLLTGVVLVIGTNFILNTLVEISDPNDVGFNEVLMYLKKFTRFIGFVVFPICFVLLVTKMMFTFNDHSYDSTIHREKINASNNMKVNLNKNSYTQRNKQYESSNRSVYRTNNNTSDENEFARNMLMTSVLINSIDNNSGDSGTSCNHDTYSPSPSPSYSDNNNSYDGGGFDGGGCD